MHFWMLPTQHIHKVLKKSTLISEFVNITTVHEPIKYGISWKLCCLVTWLIICPFCNVCSYKTASNSQSQNDLPVYFFSRCLNKRTHLETNARMLFFFYFNRMMSKNVIRIKFSSFEIENIQVKKWSS
jgi:hypothetical protein